MNLPATMRKRAIFSICSNNYFPYARILFTSLKEYHPEVSLFLCLADTPQPEIELKIADVEVIPVADLEITNFLDFAFRYDIMEFNTAIKPFFLDWLIRERGFEEIVYLDPDIELFAPMKPVFDAFEKGADFAITPHITAPAEFDEFPDDIGIMKAGIYNLGFIALNNSQEAQNFLQWWKRRLRYQCINQQDQGIFVDQKFVDLLPAFHQNVAILRDRTLNVAYWNLDRRKLSQTSEGWLVDGEPLIFFHFSGIDSQQPNRLSKHTERFQDYLDPAIQSIINRYLESLQKFQDNSVNTSYGYGKFSNQIAIADLMRRCYRDSITLEQNNPFETFHLELNQPSGLLSNLSPWRVTKLMRYLWEQRIDLQIAFDLTHLQGRFNYALWFVQNAASHGIDDYFLNPILDTTDPNSKKYQLILLVNKVLGKTTWQMRTLLKKSLWLPRKLTKPLRLLLK
ncbi:conserved hypothetical protein [Hyella patelloides LEGE 07179]|uniref:Glycosyl transferase n=1 Tax=Hyella patelloides LEGE 07179 TaxID=945734 RepID=A0A563VXM6_9CYAN|nr:hypothetical protein [Hyella patelloides]VEP16208.1 conserved hypothetical protein [Hyella patelloides LEGE 07179]